MSGVREIAFDTETTGFDARGDDRVTEIGCVELIDFLPTGKTWHAHINPQREISARVTEITGLTTEFLKDKPLFKDVADGFCEFVGNSPLVAHNADFDRGFINAELERSDFEPYPRNRFIDTLVLARQKFPGASNSLDALCKRFDISLASRTTHGALIDAELLAKVYLELKGGRVRSFDLQNEKKDAVIISAVVRSRPSPLPSFITEEEQAKHKAFVDNALGETAIWNRGKA
ncbi:MAG: DNA polymerase III subunit epsilon [Robiginitomaculum sp.]|nr:DNA polymerase III subunit epsilon [Robiginitomaculum sp.]